MLRLHFWTHFNVQASAERTGCMQLSYSSLWLHSVKGAQLLPQIADIWSCGVMLYVMLVGAYPFERPEDKHDNKKLQKMIQVNPAQLLCAHILETANIACSFAVAAVIGGSYPMSWQTLPSCQSTGCRINMI